MSRRPAVALPLVALLASLAGCGDGGSGDPPTDTTPPAAPIADRIVVASNPPPEADLVSGLAGAVEGGATVIARNLVFGTEIGRATAAADGSFGPIAVGDNQYSGIPLIARDPTGNESGPTVVSNDVAGPMVSFVGHPPDPSVRLVEYAFTLGADETATYSCALDGGAEAPCGASFTVGPLASGSHAIAVRAVDAAGNASGPWTYGWQVNRAWWQVSVGFGGSACAVDTEGALFCWGSDPRWGTVGVGDLAPRADPTPVASVATGWASVSVGSRNACGVRRDGTLRCWGLNDAGQIDGSSTNRLAPAQVGSDGDWAEVAAGGHHVCARKTSGTLLCWGRNDIGQLGSGVRDPGAPASAPIAVAAGTGTRWVEVVAGYGHACGRRDDTSAWCWGEAGLVGDGSSEHQPTPSSLGSGWTRLFAGQRSTCGLRGSDLWCWGDVAGSAQPTPALAGTGYAGASAGLTTQCGWTTGGFLSCRGSNDRGQLGDGTNAPRVGFVTVSGIWAAQASSGGETTCAIGTDGALSCWGVNHDGKVGIGTIGRKTTPVLVAEGLWSAVRAGASHTCAVGGMGPELGALYCWGANWDGQLGTSTTTHEKSRTRVGPAPGAYSPSWLDASLGASHTCGRAVQGEIATYCWGRGAEGQLSVDASLVPQYIGTTWGSLDAGASHTCGVRGGALECWGANGAGQLGDGTTTGRMDPAPVASVTAFDAVSAGEAHTCGIAAGKLYCWGSNASGRLGIDGVAEALVPTVDVGGSEWSSVSAGVAHTCGVHGAVGGMVHCWGANDSGQAGLGATGWTSTPTSVGLYALTADRPTVSAGATSSCAIVDGKLYCWGSNADGQLGLGQTSPIVPAPARLGTLTGWTAVAVGASHACGANAGGLHCWGSNEFGQLGDGTAWYESPQTVLLP